MKTTEILEADEVIEFDKDTGEILVTGSYSDFTKMQQTKIKALRLLTSRDFVMINGTWEAKRDALLKILTSLPISYSWKIQKNTVNEQFAQINATLSVQNGRVTKIADAVGICEFSELKGNGGRHFMNARAETRALKRAIETIFGSVINYYIVNYLIAPLQQHSR
jgi:hypothetical protein